MGIGEKNNQVRLKKMIWLVRLSIIITMTELVTADADSIKNLPATNNNGDIIEFVEISHWTNGLNKYG